MSKATTSWLQKKRHKQQERLHKLGLNVTILSHDILNLHYCGPIGLMLIQRSLWSPHWWWKTKWWERCEDLELSSVVYKHHRAQSMLQNFISQAEFLFFQIKYSNCGCVHNPIVICLLYLALLLATWSSSSFVLSVGSKHGIFWWLQNRIRGAQIQGWTTKHMSGVWYLLDQTQVTYEYTYVLRELLIVFLYFLNITGVENMKL